jgi:hypothetical protein
VLGSRETLNLEEARPRATDARLAPRADQFRVSGVSVLELAIASVAAVMWLLDDGSRFWLTAIGMGAIFATELSLVDHRWLARVLARSGPSSSGMVSRHRFWVGNRLRTAPLLAVIDGVAVLLADRTGIVAVTRILADSAPLCLVRAEQLRLLERHRGRHLLVSQRWGRWSLRPVWA